MSVHEIEFLAIVKVKMTQEQYENYEQRKALIAQAVFSPGNIQIADTMAFKDAAFEVNDALPNWADGLPWQKDANGDLLPEFGFGGGVII